MVAVEVSVPRRERRAAGVGEREAAEAG